MSNTAIVISCLLSAAVAALVSHILTRYTCHCDNEEWNRWFDEYRREIEVCNAQYERMEQSEILRRLDRTDYGKFTPISHKYTPTK